MTRRVIVCFAACVLLACGHAGTQQQDQLARLLAENAAARGGEARLEAMQALRLEIHLKEPTFEVKGAYFATRDGYVRIDVFVEEQRVFSEAIGPGGGWQWPGGGQEIAPLSDDGEAALWRGWVSNLYALYAWPEQGYHLSLEPGADDRHSMVVATEGGGFTKRLWIDRQSGLETRVYELSALHPDVDDTRVEQYSTVREWMSVNGLQIPRVTEKIDVTTGEVMQRSTVLSAELVFEEDVRPGWMHGGHFLPPEF